MNGAHRPFMPIGCRAIGLITLLFAPPPAHAGHHYPDYIDGGQSANGRFTVTAQAVHEKKGKQTVLKGWTFTWTDNQTKASHTGDLAGLSKGGLQAHIFVGPDGERFALWHAKEVFIKERIRGAKSDTTDPKWRKEAFSRRLVIYDKQGKMVKECGVEDYLTPAEMSGVGTVFERIGWLKPYVGDIKKRTTPRPNQCLYRVSPDYTVLEIQPAAPRNAKGRTLRISLHDGSIIDPKNWSNDSTKVPVPPFKNSRDLSQLALDVYESYQPSLDPVRVEGTFRKEKPQ